MRNPIVHEATPRLPAASVVLAAATLLLAGLPAARGGAAPAGGVPGDAGDPSRLPAGGQPARYWTFRGGGWGHGVGMSQYGALDMAQRRLSAGKIIGFYYGGARVAAATLPATIRVGLLHGRADGITVRAGRVPGTPAAGRLRLTATDLDTGGPLTQDLEQGVALRVVPDGGGLAVTAGGRPVFGHGKPGAVLRVGYARGGTTPVLVTLPQARRTLRWGHLEIATVGSGSATRLRAVATMSWTAYLRGLAEVPRAWPVQAQRAQAIAARSYALATVRATGQHRGAASPAGCDCAVYADTRDQHYLGWGQEHGPGGDRWVAAVAATKGQAIVWQGRTLVKAFYSSSNGGHTAGSDVWGGTSPAYYPARPDPYDRAGGRNPFHSWTERRTEATVSAALADLRVGKITGIRVVTRDRSGRLRIVLITGTSGSALLAGQVLQRRLKLRSTRLRSAIPPPSPDPDPDPEPEPSPDPPGSTLPSIPDDPYDPGHPGEPGDPVEPGDGSDDEPGDGSGGWPAYGFRRGSVAAPARRLPLQ